MVVDKAARDAYYASLKVPLLIIYIRDGGICWLCGGQVDWDEASRDHVVPRKFNGKTVPRNIRLAHKSCNSYRGHRPVNSGLARQIAAKRVACGWK